MITIELYPDIKLSSDLKVFNTYALLGNFNVDTTRTTIKFWELFYKEALDKYERMHSKNSETRFEKSWTGFLGEQILKYVLSKRLHINVISRNVIIDAFGYDGGDIMINRNGINSIINVSSRKLSNSDNVYNVINYPHNYFALIPCDQFNQYTQKAQHAFFIFICFDKSSKQTISIDGNNLSFFSTGEFVIPGYLKSKDLISMKSSGLLFRKNKGEILTGQYSDLSFAVPMYTDNYVIFISMLRSFSI